MTMPSIRTALALLLLSACARPAVQSFPSPATESEVVTLLQTSAGAWNEGDLEGFLLPYAETPAPTFVGSAGPIRGKDALREMYARAYWKEGGPSQRLSFEGIEVRPLGAEHALATGRWILTGGNDQGQQGLFSLVLARTPEGWRIVHDHSS